MKPIAKHNGIALFPGLFTLISTLVLNTGCTYQYSVQQAEYWSGKTQAVASHKVSRQQEWVLPADSTIYLAFPQVTQSEMALSDEHVSYQLGSALNHNLYQAMSVHFPQVTQGQQPASLAEALRSAKQAGCVFLIYPRVFHLQDGINSLLEFDELLGGFSDVGLDRIAVQLVIYDAISERLLDGVTVQSKSGWLAFYKQNPESLIADGFALVSRKLAAKPTE